jgi:hypothetical protein
MNWKLLPPVKDLHQGCANCSTAARVAPMNMLIAVGFGSAYVMKDNVCVYDEGRVEGENYWTVQDAENMAALDPGHDWQIIKHGPMHGETFQRQGERNWVCVESNKGFA